MGFFRKLSQDNRDDSAFVSVVRAMHRKISEGSRTLAPKSQPHRKISEGAQAPEYISLAPMPPPRKKRIRSQEGNSSSAFLTARPLHAHRKTSEENQIALPIPTPQRKISAGSQKSVRGSTTDINKLAAPQPRRRSNVTQEQSFDDHSDSSTPQRKLSESVSIYLITLSEELKTILHPEGLHEPELIVGLSEILDIDDVLNISSMMNFGELSWHLAYSTSLDHHSLDTFYKKIEQFQQINDNGNLLIVLKDTSKHVFGALLTSRSKHCDFFDVYNHTTLFHCRPFRPFLCWLGEHNHVVRKYADAFYAGFKDVNCGLWLNERLKTGRIQEYGMNLGLASSLSLRSTDNNLETMEALEYNFQIKTLECWSFSYK